MTVEDERAWWDGLSDEERLVNAHGFPPYSLMDVAAFLEEHLPLRQSDNVLDLGCGVGRMTNYLALGWKSNFDGVDISTRMLEQADLGRLASTRFHLGDGRTIPTIGGVFDCAYSITMFQHIPHDAVRGYLAEVHRVLKPGGVFVFSWSEGDEDAFLSHQIPNPWMLADWCREAGFTAGWPIECSGCPEGWRWMKVLK